MKIKVGYGLTINKGNYESERIDISEEYDMNNMKDIDNSINPSQAREEIFKELKEWVWQKAGKL